VWQVLKIKSPLTWASVAVSNVAARTLQPAIIDIIARRAIDLYGGHIQRRPPTGTMALPAPETAASDRAAD
jgi:hypothetical protein